MAWTGASDTCLAEEWQAHVRQKNRHGEDAL